jgi:hypothetical protein
MAKDHYIPRGYLRGFTREYLDDTKGGQIFVYPLSSGRYRSASINKHVGFEPNFYHNHPLDKAWQKIEQQWPEIIRALQQSSTDRAIIGGVLSFVAIQFVRVPATMERISRQLAWANRKTVDIEFEGRKAKAAVMDMVKTSDVLDAISATLPRIKQSAENEYFWTCYHNPFRLRFITSDNPCYYDSANREVFLPVTLDLGLSGKRITNGRKPGLEHDDASHETVRRFNRLTVKNAIRFVYSHASSERLRDVIKRHRIDRDTDPLSGGRSWTNEPTEADWIGVLKHVEELRRKDRSSQQGKSKIP